MGGQHLMDRYPSGHPPMSFTCVWLYCVAILENKLFLSLFLSSLSLLASSISGSEVEFQAKIAFYAFWAPLTHLIPIYILSK